MMQYFEQDVTTLPQPQNLEETKRMWEAPTAERKRLDAALAGRGPEAGKLYQDALQMTLAEQHFYNHYYYLLRQLYPPVYDDYPSPEEIAEWDAMMARPKREPILAPYVPGEDDEEDEEE